MIQQWDSLTKNLNRKSKKYEKIQRQTLQSPFDAFKAAIEFDLNLSRQLEKLYTYAHLKAMR
jgi:hypothetical protein